MSHFFVAIVCITVYKSCNKTQHAVAKSEYEQSETDPRGSQLLVHEVNKVGLEFQDVDDD